MLRRLFTLLRSLSLLLCVGTIALWVHSYFAAHTLRHAAEAAETVWWSEAGRLGVTRSYSGEAGASTDTGWMFATSPPAPRADVAFTKGHQFRYRAIGFELTSYHPTAQASWAPGVHTANTRYWTVAVPHWFAAAGLALPPALWIWRRWLRRRPDRRGLCPRCRYDLTGNLSGTCPECGAPVARAAA